MKLTFLFIWLFSTLALALDKREVVLEELNAIHGMNTKRIYNAWVPNLAELRSFLRDLYGNPEQFIPEIKPQDQIFAKYNVIGLYCNYIPISEGLKNEDRNFLEEIKNDSEITNNANLKLSIYSCLRVAGSREALEYLLKLYDEENSDELKQQILDAATQLLGYNSENVQNPGDLTYDEAVYFNLTEPFYSRDPGPWSASIQDLIQKNKKLAKTMIARSPREKVVKDTFRGFAKLLKDAYLLAENNKFVKTNSQNNLDSSSGSNNKKDNKKVSGRKPQSIDEDERQAQNQKNSNGYGRILLGILFVLLLMYFFRKKAK